MTTQVLSPPPVEGILTPEALAFVERLHVEIAAARRDALAARPERRGRIAAGDVAIADTGGDWRVPAAPPDLLDRRVEITGPTDRKMLINALNSGARCFMADLEDANAPFWAPMLEGQGNLRDAVRGSIALETPEKTYRLVEEPATLLVRPRGWHLEERNVTVDDEPVSASVFDAGLFLFHDARAQLERGATPALYLPKLESASEAAIWDEALALAEDLLGIPPGAVRVTVLIETLPAAFEMDAILFALRDRASGLNAGRWDYLFSAIKVLGSRPDVVFPDRAQLTMTVPFMRAYTELLVKTCHRRGAHAIGGMAAFVPNRRKPEVTATALAKVREDKEREAGDGFDGTWVAHPDLVPAATQVFDAALGDRPHQLERIRSEVAVTAEQLLDVDVPGGGISEAGLRNDVAVAIRYLASWLDGHGAVAIFDLMEDTATAEIARSQVWQWLRHGATLDDGRTVDEALVRELVAEEADAARLQVEDPTKVDDAAALFERLVITEDLADFLTLAAVE